MIPGWKVYNHALLPITPPHEEPNLEVIKNSIIWDWGVLLVRYTSDFDCGYKTEWWYCIKDNPMDISHLKAKQRYEISCGLKNFEVRKISAKDYAEQVYTVYDTAFKNYKNKGQAESKERFIAQCVKHENNAQIEYYGAFDKDSGDLGGYALNHVYNDYVNFTTIKFIPKFLSKKVSAALIYTMLCDYLNTQNKKYVNDGERSIRHSTNFQDYLIKYFGFRKAYSKIHVHYKPVMGLVVKMLFPFQKLIKRFESIPAIHNVSALLDMEEIRRRF